MLCQYRVGEHGCDGEAMHYAQVILTYGDSWESPGTDYADDYVCLKCLPDYIQSFTTGNDVEILEIKVERLGLTARTGGL